MIKNETTVTFQFINSKVDIKKIINTTSLKIVNNSFRYLIARFVSIDISLESYQNLFV